MEAAQSLGKGDREEATREVGGKQEGPSRGAVVNRSHAAEMGKGRAACAVWGRTATEGFSCRFVSRRMKAKPDQSVQKRSESGLGR